VAKVEQTDLAEGIPVSGTLEPGVDIRMASPIAEVVEAVLVNEGDAVKKGQTLARFQASVFDAQATSAEAQRRIAASDYERMKNLFAEGAVSQKDVENAELNLRATEANEAQAKKRLTDATIRAPVSGVISERLVESGNRVKDGDHLFQLVNTDSLDFEATVPSQYAGSLKPGAPVALSITGLSEGAHVSGKVSRVNAAVDPSTRQVKVYVTVPNPEHRMVGGLFASGRVVLKDAHAALAVPKPGIRSDGKNTYVLIVDAGKVTRRDVVTGVTDEMRSLVEIKRGLSGGEMAIIGPAEGLKIGDVVQVVGREG
jgi:RND family efflux transporter MFP subunit